MPFKYIGRTTDFKGKTLWGILGNLKNFGVGRLVFRHMLQRYPEPSYFKIMKVQAVATPAGRTPDDERHVIALVEKVFRGVRAPTLIQLREASYKRDYMLVPKDEEHKFLNFTTSHQIKILPKEIAPPPLLRVIAIRQKLAAGIQVSNDLMLAVKYNMTNSALKNYKVAEGNETPTIEVNIGLGKPASPSLYKNVLDPPSLYRV